MVVLKVFSGTKTQFLCNKDSFSDDVADEATATMHLDELQRSEVPVVLMSVVMIFFFHSHDVWYRENKKHSFFFFFFDGFAKRQPPLFGLSSGTQENMGLLDSVVLLAMQLL